MTASRLTALIMTLTLGATLRGAGPAVAGDGPLACGFGRVAGLLEVTRGIECNVIAKRLTVKDVTINGGACESPIAYMARVNKSRRRSGVPDFANFRDFRKTYVAGEKFMVAVPEECDVYAYTISVEGADLTFRAR